MKWNEIKNQKIYWYILFSFFFGPVSINYILYKNPIIIDFYNEMKLIKPKYWNKKIEKIKKNRKIFRLKISCCQLLYHIYYFHRFRHYIKCQKNRIKIIAKNP